MTPADIELALRHELQAKEGWAPERIDSEITACKAAWAAWKASGRGIEDLISALKARRGPLPSLGDPPRCPAHEFVANHDAVLCQDQRINVAIRRVRDGALFQMTKIGRAHV